MKRRFKVSGADGARFEQNLTALLKALESSDSPPKPHFDTGDSFAVEILFTNLKVEREECLKLARRWAKEGILNAGGAVGTAWVQFKMLEGE
jgi:hypothetical protein